MRLKQRIGLSFASGCCLSSRNFRKIAFLNFLSLQQFFGSAPAERWLDTQFSPYGGPEHPFISVMLGPQIMSSCLYQQSPVQDLELAKTLVRPGLAFLPDLSKATKFSDERYGSIPRVYIVCQADRAIPPEFQSWMIENRPVNEVMEIEGADHMAMLSKPQEICSSIRDGKTVCLKDDSTCKNGP